jgi:hypothetical protein
MVKMRKITACNLFMAALSLAACLSLVVSGCSEKGTGGRKPDIAPDTFISFGPKMQEETYFKVQAFWYGADEDGDIETFEVATVKNVSEYDLDAMDLDDLAWGRTVSRESTFVLVSDSCCASSGDAKYALSPWGIFVRAVDNDGRVDPSPATLFFTATNVLPKVAIVVPRKLPIDYMDVPPHPYIQWEGEDPDGDDPGLQYKYLVIPERDMNPTFPRLPPLDHDSSGTGHGAPPVGYWSEWVPADCTFVKDLNLSLYAGLGTDYLVRVYLTAKDEGGAALPENLYGSYNNGRNWLNLLIVPRGAGVTILIGGGVLGTNTSMDKADYETQIAGMFLGTEISFRFYGDEEKGRGEIAEAYRYYYDSPDGPGSAWNYWTSTEPIRERGRIPEWFVRFPLDGSKFVPSLGRHAFVVEVRDLNSEVSHCEFNIEVLKGPGVAAEHKILVVDDTQGGYLEPTFVGLSDSLYAFWSRILEGYNWEWFDTGNTFDEEVPIRLVGLSTTVIWLVDEDMNSGTQLLQICTVLGNYLHSYVKVGGNLIISGMNPVYASAYYPNWVEGQQPLPAMRGSMNNANFKPVVSRASEGDTVVNFNWDVFGINRLAKPQESVLTEALWPCEGCWQDSVIETIPPLGKYWHGYLEGGFYIKDIRTLEDAYPLHVERLFGTAYRDTAGEWVYNGDDYLMGAYVPGDAVRGHAAYIGVPVYWFNHGKMKTFMRKLLEEFGEHPVGS